MGTSKRTDLHRPSAIVPADYQFVACDYLGGGLEAMHFLYDRQAFHAHMAQTHGKFANATRGGGTCDVCGANALYIARFYYAPTNQYINTGMDCAAKMEIGDPVLFAAFRKRVAAGLAAKAGKAKAQQVLAAAGLQEAWAMYNDPKLCSEVGPYPGDAAAGNMVLMRAAEILYDVVGKLVKYGSASDAQLALLAKLVAQVNDRHAKLAQWAAERAARAAAGVACPTGRMMVTGLVKATKTQESQWGVQHKMVVLDDRGFTVWTTIPSNLPVDIKGCRVTFTATLTQSDKDVTFGFASRPTKATLLTEPGASPATADPVAGDEDEPKDHAFVNADREDAGLVRHC